MQKVFSDPFLLQSTTKAQVKMQLEKLFPQESRLEAAAELILAFVQNNWTGPFFESPPDDVLKLLAIDGEDVYHLIKSPILLLCAKLLLEQTEKSFFAHLWSIRCFFIHQRILEEHSNTLLELITNELSLAQSILPCENAVEFYLEQGQIFHYYGYNKKALESFKKAQEYSGLQLEITGALGKRTKFQTFDVTQLILVAKSSNPCDVTNTDKIPENLNLNDDTLLEKITFTDDHKIDNLKTIDQCIILALCLNVKNTNPVDGLTNEQMKPYVQRVLENPNNWTVHTMALLLRSRLEAQKSRTVQRSVLQIQALVDQMAIESEAPVSERLEYFFSLLIPSKWEFECELARSLMSIGVVKSALEIFERLEIWDSVISCLQMLSENEKAEKVVRKCLESDPSPKLYCLLGDVTLDISHYHYAWNLSSQGNSRAMRSLGAHHFRNGNFIESVDCYNLALSLNPLFENSWFVMGCAAIRCEDWVNAQKAFQKTVLLNADNGEAWTNLASVYTKIQKKREAWRALKEALRQHHDNAKIWDNYLFISIDVCEFPEAVRAMTRIFDIRSALSTSSKADSTQFIDLDCLQILVNFVGNYDSSNVQNQDPNGTDENDASLLSEIEMTANVVNPLIRLVKAVTSKISNSPRLYNISAELFAYLAEYKTSLDFIIKAYRIYINNPLDEGIFLKAVNQTRRLVEAYKEFGPMEEKTRMAADEELVIVCKDWKFQAKMALKSMLGATKASFEEHLEFEKLLNLLKTF